MRNWDVTIYRNRGEPGRYLARWLIVIRAPDYKTAFKEARRRHPTYHSSCFRIERV